MLGRPTTKPNRLQAVLPTAQQHYSIFQESVAPIFNDVKDGCRHASASAGFEITDFFSAKLVIEACCI